MDLREELQNPHFREAIFWAKDYAEKAYQTGDREEKCGLIVVKDDGAMEFIALKNIAANPVREFAMANEEIAMAVFQAHGIGIKAWWHSHPSGNGIPSGDDWFALYEVGRLYGVLTGVVHGSWGGQGMLYGVTGTGGRNVTERQAVHL